jgi:hypothetical protein
MAHNVQQVVNAGQYNAAFTGGNVETAIYTSGPGVLNKFAITTAGTASLSIYDGTNSTAGTLIFTSLTNDALGVIKDCGLAFTTGLVVKGTTGAAGIAVFYSKAGANGN